MYYHNGRSTDDGMDLFLLLDVVDDRYVNAEASDIFVLGEDGLPTRSLLATRFTSKLRSSYLGYQNNNKKLEQSGMTASASSVISLSRRMFTLKKELVISLFFFIQVTCINILATS
jgi:hypothetical protein